MLVRLRGSLQAGARDQRGTESRETHLGNQDAGFRSFWASNPEYISGMRDSNEWRWPMNSSLRPATNRGSRVLFPGEEQWSDFDQMASPEREIVETVGFPEGDSDLMCGQEFH